MTMKLETARKHDRKIYPFHLGRGLYYKYPICCIMYFQYVHPIMRYEIPELQQTTKNRIMCPNCIIENIPNNRRTD